MTIHLTAPAAPLAAAATRVARLLPVRAPLSGVLLRAAADGLWLLASDGEVSVRVRVPAQVHEPGEVVVPRRAVADTLAALDAPEVRLRVEGSRLAVRAPSARFALPLLDPGAVLPPP